MFNYNWEPVFGYKIDEAKSLFFDAGPVVRALDVASHKVLSRFGAMVRRTARTSIRKPPAKTLRSMTDQERANFRRAQAIAKRRGLPPPKRPTVDRGSPPGKPPYDRTGFLRQFIWFGYDATERSVVIGPALLNRGSGAPETLEYGGTTTISTGASAARRDRRVAIAARPYMGPAEKKEEPKLPGMWRDSIKA